MRLYSLYTYLRQLLQIPDLAQGISRYNISKNGVMKIEVPLPDLQEQKALGEYFQNLDNLITLHQRKSFKTEEKMHCFLDLK